MGGIGQCTRGKLACFSLAKGGEKDLERMRRCYVAGFYLISEIEIVWYVNFNLFDNTQPHLGALFLQRSPAWNRCKVCLGCRPLGFLERA